MAVRVRGWALVPLVELLGMNSGPTTRKVVEVCEPETLGYCFSGDGPKKVLRLACGHCVFHWKAKIPKRVRCLKCDET